MPATTTIPAAPVERPSARRLSKVRRFLTRVDAPEGSDCACAVIAIDPADRATIVRRRQLFEDARRADADLSSLRFRNDAMTLYFDDESGPGDPDDDFAALPAGTRVRRASALRTEADAMIVEAEGVCWVAGPKHEDGWIFTRQIPYADLLDPAQLCAALSAEEHEALGYTARILGGTWKADLAARWRKGGLQTLPLEGATLAILQRLAATLGPRGLAAYGAGEG